MLCASWPKTARGSRSTSYHGRPDSTESTVARLSGNRGPVDPAGRASTPLSGRGRSSTRWRTSRPVEGTTLPITRSDSPGGMGSSVRMQRKVRRSRGASISTRADRPGPSGLSSNLISVAPAGMSRPNMMPTFGTGYHTVARISPLDGIPTCTVGIPSFASAHRHSNGDQLGPPQPTARHSSPQMPARGRCRHPQINRRVVPPAS